MPQPILEPKVLSFIKEHRLVSGLQKLVVAVSGGPDSVCLLYILTEIQNELGVRLHVAHLNHQLRGTESEADAQYVSDLAHRLHIPATIERREVKAYQLQQRISPEEAAREVRYTFLAGVAKSIGADRIAVGHTVDDHIETILMHLIRGTGTRGLRGLQPISRWQSAQKEGKAIIIRPLLPISRQETASYCHQHRLMPRLDVTNLSLSPLRNRIRHQLLPRLQSYNPRVVEALLRTARITSDDLTFIDREASKAWSRIIQEQADTIVLDKAGFCQLPRALQRHILRAAIEKLSGNLKDTESHHIEAMLTALNKPAGKRLSLPRGLIFTIDYNKYLLSPDPASLSPLPTLGAESPLKIPGQTVLNGWRVTADIVKRDQMPEKASGLTAHLDFEKTGDKIAMRRRQPGDRFQPLGMDQPKKLGEFMIDAKIPRAWRERVPIVRSPQHILWVVGWRIDNRVKVTDSTKQILILEFSPG